MNSGEEIFRSFKDPALAAAVAERLSRLRPKAELTLMHVCGTHEHAVARAGIRSLLPEGVRLVAGPGCPVCVCPAADIDLALQAAQRDGVIVATFGDMFRVPAQDASLEILRAEGCDVRVIYSPLDAVRIAADNPDSTVVFLAVGFETTAGPIAAALESPLPSNLTLITSLRLIPPALAFLIGRACAALDGLILPGHVSTVLGRAGYAFLEGERGVPAVIAGFDPVDILLALAELIEMALQGNHRRVRNLYRRAVAEQGNERARAAIGRVFEVVDSSWRGIGTIPGSGLALRGEFRRLDAQTVLGLERRDGAEDTRPDCICHEVILGESEPESCPLFARACTPRRPCGPCMVSSEGTCRARYQYRRAPVS